MLRFVLFSDLNNNFLGQCKNKIILACICQVASFFDYRVNSFLIATWQWRGQIPSVILTHFGFRYCSVQWLFKHIFYQWNNIFYSQYILNHRKHYFGFFLGSNAYVMFILNRFQVNSTGLFF